ENPGAIRSARGLRDEPFAARSGGRGFPSPASIQDRGAGPDGGAVPQYLQARRAVHRIDAVTRRRRTVDPEAFRFGRTSDALLPSARPDDADAQLLQLSRPAAALQRRGNG